MEIINKGNKMKLWTLCIFKLLILFGLSANAQLETPPVEQLKSLQIAYLTKQLSLTPEEAEKFWPIYNSFTDEIEKVRKDTRSLARDIRLNFLSMGDEEIESLADEIIVNKQAEGDLYATYHERFKSVLPVRKVILLYKAEQDFKKEILKLWRQKQMENRKRN